MNIKHFTLAGFILLLPALYLHSSRATASGRPATSNDVTLKDEISDRDQQHIQVPTTGLFDEESQITIDLSTLGRNDWCYPMRNGRVISPYGGRRRGHSGIDIKTHAGDTIYAAFAGRVRFAKRYSGYGNVIVLRHSTGLETVYSHNQRHLVRIGDIVRAGQPIAIVGRTGRATTEHCHFEVRINGKAHNPARFFDTAARALRSQRVIAYKSGKIETYNVVPANNMAESK